MVELLPCPFCGGEAENDFQQAYRAIQDGRIDHGAAVYCTRCNANMIMCRADHPELSDEQRMAVMVENWNRRAAPPQPNVVGSRPGLGSVATCDAAGDSDARPPIVPREINAVVGLDIVAEHTRENCGPNDTDDQQRLSDIHQKSPLPAANVASFQARVQPWMMACFGPEISADRLERNDRFIEEALELVQASSYPKERVLALVDYVYGRDQGEINQEVGGVMVTLAAHCLAHGVNMHEAAETELARIWTKVEKIRAKQAAKPTGSALPIGTTEGSAE